MDTSISKTRRRLQAAIEEADAERRRLMLNKRIDLASSGLKAFEANKHGAAVKAFHSYLRILEDWKGVKEGGLNPSLFDPKKDAAELLLISGVYWDLVKLYDRTKTNEKRAEFLHYLEKFILFSKGMPYQGLCAETLRKYMAIDRPRHVQDFKHAYKMIGMSNCFIATELSDLLEIETLPRLRSFRDDYLAEYRAGKLLIHTYYKTGPFLADMIDLCPEALRKALAKSLDRLSKYCPDPVRPEEEVTLRKIQP